MKTKLEDFRRDAYVDAIYAKMEKDNVVGVFSDKVEALLISYGFIVYPILGLDSYIFDYFKLDNICDPINSTIAYLKTKKCPLIYASRFINNLDERISFLEKIKTKYDKKKTERKIIKATCPYGVSDIIDKKICEDYKIVRSKNPDFTFEKCIYEADEILTYKEK